MARTYYRWLLVAVLLTGIASFYALGWNEYLSFDAVRANLDSIDAQVEEHLFLAALLFFVVYTVVTSLSLPFAAPLSLLAGALFGHVLGIAIALTAATCGATMAFLSSRFVLRDWVQTRFGAHLGAINQGMERDGAFYLFSLRLVPFIPFFAINLCMGLTPIRVWTYAWVSFVGMLPGCVLFVNAGTQLRQLRSPSDILSLGFMISFIALGLAPLIFRKLLARRRLPESGKH